MNKQEQRSLELFRKCAQLVCIDRVQTVAGQLFEDMDTILMGNIMDLDGLPPVHEDHPRWWIRENYENSNSKNW